MFISPSRHPDKSINQNLYRLFMLRNLMIAGEAFVILITHNWLDIALPGRPLAAIIGVLAIINLLTWVRLRTNFRATELEFLIQLVLDVVQFTALLYFTGGATNPFAWFYLLPVIIAATVLPRRFTWTMAGLTTACYTFVLFYHIPLPGMVMHHAGFEQHVFGMWFGFVLSAGLIAYFVVGMANTLRERDRKLAEAREQALRDERLVALGTLAAGAAHELGTPLGTMAILTRELSDDYPLTQFNDLHSKLGILRDQVDRCKEALSVISASAGEARAESGHPMAVDSYLREVIDQWSNQRPNVALEYRPQTGSSTSCIVAELTLTQALINILNNAADASPEHIVLQASWDAAELVLEVSDRGHGFDLEAVSTVGNAPFSTKDHGLGIGLYLAQATVRRLGGKLSLFNLQGGGACTRVMLPLFNQAEPLPV